MTDRYQWWQQGSLYQVYPRSFLDSNDDGVGDLPGLLERLDYLHWLGVDALWLNPIYPSPMRDFGYDVADYTSVDPIFGTMADFDRLVAEVHRLGMKLILDYVPNHTSTEHAWFRQSRSATDNPYRDWYLWRAPAPGGGPPNNWLGAFGGSAWQWDETTGEYYFHSYLTEQADLNWRNPDVREAMLDVLRFWLDRDVDGFRVDGISRLIKDDRWRDNPPNPNYHLGENPYDALLPVYSVDQPEVHAVIDLIRAVVDEYEDRVLIGEAWLAADRLIAYYGSRESGIHFPFNFQLITSRWNAESIRLAVDSYEGLLPHHAWPSWVLGNHDRSRVASRLGPAQARVAAMLLLTLRGTPTIYYGDEIGMYDVSIPSPKMHDPFEHHVPGLGLGRDPQRTPMQWNTSLQAGFTHGRPWLPVADSFETINVAIQRDDPGSMLTLYRRLLGLRAEHRALQVGTYTPLGVEEHVYCYVRRHEETAFLVGLNFSDEPVVVEGTAELSRGQIRLSTYLDREGEAIAGRCSLRGQEGVIVEVRR